MLYSLAHMAVTSIFGV